MNLFDAFVSLIILAICQFCKGDSVTKGVFTLNKEDNSISWSSLSENTKIFAQGRDTVRVISNDGHPFARTLGGLVSHNDTETEHPWEKEVQAHLSSDGSNATLRNGMIKAVIVSSNPQICFFEVIGKKEKELLCEYYPQHGTEARFHTPLSRGSQQIKSKFSFKAYSDENFYGLGIQPDIALNRKNYVVDLQQFNSRVCIPFTISSRGYGFLWNQAGRGRVEFSAGKTRWEVESTSQVDYLIFAGSRPENILERYVEATGHPSPMPAHLTGFWQSKNRYATQKELLKVYRKFRTLQIPLSVLVIDYHHWAYDGDWDFNTTDWPNVKAMADEVKAGNVSLMVSVWPTVDARSQNFNFMNQHGLLTRGDYGYPNIVSQGKSLYFSDVFNPATRAYLWKKLRKAYIDKGMPMLWLDSCEGDNGGERIYGPLTPSRYFTGSNLEVGLAYPFEEQKMIHEGYKSMNMENEYLSLSRSAWVGSQRFGTVVWTGDVSSTFEELKHEIKKALSLQASGIPWFTSDAGGYFSGKVESPLFQEVLMRWMEFSTFSPVMRLHGSRACDNTHGFLNCPNEPWSYGDKVFKVITFLIQLREKLRPYIQAMTKLTEASGIPLQRAMWFSFPEDPVAVPLDDQYLFGEDLLVAPIYEEGKNYRKVYFPTIDKDTNFDDEKKSENFWRVSLENDSQDNTNKVPMNQQLLSQQRQQKQALREGRQSIKQTEDRSQMWINCWTGEAVFPGTWAIVKSEFGKIPLFFKGSRYNALLKGLCD